MDDRRYHDLHLQRTSSYGKVYVSHLLLVSGYKLVSGVGSSFFREYASFSILLRF